MALFHISIHPAFNEDKMDVILKKLNMLHSHIDYLIKQQKEMANEINAYLDRLQAGFQGIKQDIQDLKDGLPSEGGMTAEQTAQVKSRLASMVEEVEALDAENTRPEVPEDPQA